MKSFRVLLSDRRRAQRGSVLSAVLIMVAFLAILSGALVTELSTNFLLSRNLVNRVANEATVNSAMELSLSGLQDTQTAPLFNGCPTPGTAGLNGMSAVAGYASCFPVIDRGSAQTLQGLAAGGPFLTDGTHAAPPGTGVDEYLVGDTKGNLVAFPRGSTSRAWSTTIGGEIVGTPLAMVDASAPSDGVLYLEPVTNPSSSLAPGCSNDCVALLSGDGGSVPDYLCGMNAAPGGQVTSQPAAGGSNTFPTVAYFGDSAGNLYAYLATSDNQPGNQCAQQDMADISNNVPGAGAVLAGPFVIGAGTKQKPVDEVYAVVANGSGGDLVHYSYSVGNQQQADLKYVGVTALPGVPAGAALKGTTLALTFTNGQVALAQIQANFTTTLGPSRQLSGAIGDAPSWNGPSQIGAAAGSTLYVLDASLNVLSSFAAPSTITTTPAFDQGGDWFVGTAAGTLYVAPAVGPSQLVPVAANGGGAITSAPMAFPCATGICIYTGSSDGNVYFAGLDARDAVLDSCISACAKGNFSLRALVEVGAAGSPRTVHVQGWSYYSP